MPEYFSEDVSLPDLRSPFGAIEENYQPGFAHDLTEKIPVFPKVEPQEPEAFRQQTTAQAVKELVEPSADAAEETRLSARSEDEPVSHAQLCLLFEQFLGQLRGEAALASQANALAETQVPPWKVSVNDRTEEIDQLKSLLIEAQETIIKLLTDRVEDRSRIATLELELKYLPGPPLSSDEQLKLIGDHEILSKELRRVRQELEQLERVHANFKLKQKRRPFWLRFWQFLQTGGGA